MLLLSSSRTAYLKWVGQKNRTGLNSRESSVTLFTLLIVATMTYSDDAILVKI